MKIRLLIDIETDDVERLQEFVAHPPLVRLEFLGEEKKTDWAIWGRFMGAVETH